MADLVLKNDGWQNTLKKIGRSKKNYKYLPCTEPPLHELADLYDGSWLARAIVSILPQWALAPGFKVRGVQSEEKQEEILRAWRRLDFAGLQADGVLERSLAFGRLFGGSAMMLGTVARNYEKPIAPPGEEELVFLDTVRRDELQIVSEVNDVLSPNHGEPEIYRICGNHKRRGLRIHASRLVMCEGLPSAARYRTNSPDLGWISVLQPLIENLQDYDIAWASVGKLLEESSIGVFKMKGLLRMLSTQSEEEIRTRFDILNEGKSVTNSIFLDAEFGEDYDRIAASFSDLPQVLQQITLKASATAQIPVTVLFGQSPAGLNATGESDLEQWFARVSNYRDVSLRPKLETALGYLIGEPVQIDFPELRTPKPRDLADLQLARRQSDQILFTTGMLTAEELIRARIADGTLGLDVDQKAVERRLQAESLEPSATGSSVGGGADLEVGIVGGEEDEEPTIKPPGE